MQRTWHTEFSCCSGSQQQLQQFRPVIAATSSISLRLSSRYDLFLGWIQSSYRRDIARCTSSQCVLCAAMLGCHHQLLRGAIQLCCSAIWSAAYHAYLCAACSTPLPTEPYPLSLYPVCCLPLPPRAWALQLRCCVSGSLCRPAQPQPLTARIWLRPGSIRFSRRIP